MARAGSLEAVAYRLATAALRPLEKACVRGGLRADAVTLGSLVIAALAGTAASMGAIGWAGGLYLFSGALDLMDGRIARLTGTVSARGAALDSIVDRVSEALVLGGLAWGLHTAAAAAVCFAMMSASMVVSYARARGEGLGVSVDDGMMARGPRVALLAFTMMAAGLLGGARSGHASTSFLVGLVVLTVLTAWTAGTRVAKVLDALPGPRSSRTPSPPPPRIRPVA